MLIKVFCVLSKLPPVGRGGGGGGATGLLNKGGGATGFLWNFHRYRLVIIIDHTGKNGPCEKYNTLESLFPITNVLVGGAS